MFPPPGTIATCTPEPATRTICRAMRWTASGSSPCPPAAPPRASPESFRRMRWQGFCMPKLARTLLAYLNADERLDLRALAELLLQDLLDGLRVVLHPLLLGQDLVRVELLELAAADLLLLLCWL